MERGPLKLTVEAGPKTAVVGDVVTVTIRAAAPAEYVLALPEEKDFGDLAAHTTATPDPQPGTSGMLWRRVFEVQPLVSGTLEIPALTAKYGRKASSAETQPALDGELVSNALKLEIRSVLTDRDNPQQPRDITGTLLPPKPPLPWWLKALVAIAAVGVVGGLYAGYRVLRRRALRPPPPILPEVWALRALSELERTDWFDVARVREYYYRLTEVVRRYIELKFGLAAPEMTTEEFLVSLAHDGPGLPYETGRLRSFLEACDFVKYAASQPTREDGEQVLGTARAFVQTTAAAHSAPVQGAIGAGFPRPLPATLPQPLPEKEGSNPGGAAQ
jgi:hypothetical protein